MAGTAPTNVQFTRTLNAVPVHCSVWLFGGGLAGHRRFLGEVQKLILHFRGPPLEGSRYGHHGV